MICTWPDEASAQLDTLTADQLSNSPIMNSHVSTIAVPLSYRRSTDDHQIIYREDVDEILSSDAQLKNKMQYLYFTKTAEGGKCLIQSCRDLHLGRVVCRQTLRREFASDPEERKLFL